MIAMILRAVWESVREHLRWGSLLWWGALLIPVAYVLWFVLDDSATDRHAHGFFALLVMAIIVGIPATIAGEVYFFRRQKRH